MSRLARKPIKVPAGVTIHEGNGILLFKGGKGESSLKILPGVKIEINGDGIRVQKSGSGAEDGEKVGTMWSLIRNAVAGVSEGFSRVLEIEGVGYRAAMEGESLVLSLGYVEPVRYKIPEGVSVKIEKNAILISGVDKSLVGRTAAEIRALKKPEPYKGKGIHYRGEVVRRKVGKKAGAVAGGATT